MRTPRVELDTIRDLYALPFFECLDKARAVHRKHFPDNTIQISKLLSIKTGACPEDCGYCAQSGHHNTALKKEKLLEKEKILTRAREAQASGATRFCMGAAWRSIPDKSLTTICDIIREVGALGLETCVTLGMLSQEQAIALKEAGLDYYNHNLDTSPEYYKEIVTTRTYQDRLETLQYVREAGIKVCCGGILGMGESREDRIQLLYQLANLPEYPESVPINRLHPVKGTPLEQAEPLDNFEFIRTIAVARIIMPTAKVRLSAGRHLMSEEMHALCYLAGANSIFIGDVLLTVANTADSNHTPLLEKLGLKAENLTIEDQPVC